MVGNLAVPGFRVARQQRDDLSLVVAGNERKHALIGYEPGVHMVGHLPWESLEALVHSASLLLQPMLNDPWGQVYLEALTSRTPVLGLERHGLPAITENGRHGFLVQPADPVALAAAILDAMSAPDRPVPLGPSGQRHGLSN